MEDEQQDKNGHGKAYIDPESLHRIAAVFHAAEKVLRREQNCPDREHEGYIAHKTPDDGFHQILCPFFAEGENML